MKIIVAPKSFTYKAAEGNRTVLLLHGFTSSTNDDDQIQTDIEEFSKNSIGSLKDLQQFIVETGNHLKDIISPFFILQGCLDQPLYEKGAEIIYHSALAGKKQIQWYEESGHLMTMGIEREKIDKDILVFLDSIEWESDSHG